MENIVVKRNGDTLFIGNQPQLIANLRNQNNFIKIGERLIPYKREIALSEDLLEGKRKNVYETAIRHYYKQACQVAEGYMFLEQYKPQINTTIREIK